ncbi:MAG: hypothetical protein QM820_52205 [Minicystis sp.]
MKVAFEQMKQTLSLAFWNVHNLFREGAHPDRGPRSADEREAKLDTLARVIGRLANGGLPDLLALSEVAEEQLVRALVRRLALSLQGPIPLVFEAPVGNDTGLCLVGLTPKVAALTRVDAEARGHRPRALSVKVTLAVGGSPLHVIVCHWKSDRPTPGGPSAPSDRRRSGTWLSDHLSGSTSPHGAVDPVVVMGDFNAEPYAPEIAGSRALYATRHYAKSIRARGVRLFNSMWPWLVDPGASPAPGATVESALPPLTSHGRDEPRILDQLLVSRSILRAEVFCLAGVDYYRDADTAELLPQLRTVVPRPWDWDPASRRSTGASDHFPLVATLLY